MKKVDVSDVEKQLKKQKKDDKKVSHKLHEIITKRKELKAVKKEHISDEEIQLRKNGF